MQIDFIYGTAWKEDKTKELVELALNTGYRAIDSANQRKHYNEKQVGQAVQEWINKGNKRSDLFLQSKFTFIEGQDHRLPYDPNSPIGEQVLQSFENTLKHFNTDYLDSYLLHGPSRYDDFIERDWEVWNVMEKLYNEGKVKAIGVSNIGINHIKTLNKNANIKPHWVQNRCFAELKWDKLVRSYCLKNEIQYQGFSLLTANPIIFQHPEVIKLAEKHHKTLAQVVFKFSQKIGITPLTGTTDRQHMTEDLAIDGIEIDMDTLNKIENLLN